MQNFWMTLFLTQQAKHHRKQCVKIIGIYECVQINTKTFFYNSQFDKSQRLIVKIVSFWASSGKTKNNICHKILVIFDMKTVETKRKVSLSVLECKIWTTLLFLKMFIIHSECLLKYKTSNMYKSLAQQCNA